MFLNNAFFKLNASLMRHVSSALACKHILKPIGASTPFYRYLNYTPIETTNKIQVGNKMTQEIEKKRRVYEQNEQMNKKYEPRAASQLLIACSNKQFNHYTGQAYRNFSEKNLASLGWRNRASRDQYFTINSLGSLQTINASIDKIKELHIHPVLVQSLQKNFNIHSLTNIQYQSINQNMSRMSHNLVVAETGGGKTLAYALPVVEMCIQMNFMLNKMGIKRDVTSPLCIVLVPTRELVFQVYNVFKKLQNTDNLNGIEETNSMSEQYVEGLKNLNVLVDIHEYQLKAKRQLHPDERIECVDDPLMRNVPLDVLITMPGQLEHRVAFKKVFFNSVYTRTFIMDEADTLLDDSFNETTIKCLNKLGLNFNLKPLLTNEDESTASEETTELDLSREASCEQPNESELG